MADNESNATKVVDTQIENIGVGSWQTGLAQAVNETYSYANSSLFCAVIAGYYRDYAYRYIRPACQWLDGYVPSIHWGGSGIISTRIASSLINGISSTIVGEKLVYRIKGNKDEKALDTLRFVSDWGEKNEIIRAIKNGIAYAEAIGTSLIKANTRSTNEEEKKVWWEAVRFDNCFYLANASSEVKEATFLLRTYTDTRAEKNVCQYFLVEKRYWHYFKPEIAKNPDGTYRVVHKKGDREPVVEYKVHRANAQSLNNLMAGTTTRSSVGWSEIPMEIRKLIREDYNLIRIDEPQKLPFANLGVEVMLNEGGDISVPTGSNFGRGLIIPAISDLLVYEVAQSYAIRDMYNGKGTVYVPKAMSLGGLGGMIPDIQLTQQATQGIQDGAIRQDGSSINVKPNPATFIPNINPLEGIENKYETVPGVNPEDQSIVVNQFDLRPDQWQLIQDNALKRIALKWGMSPKILASFLAQGPTQMTATQIDSEDDISVAWVNKNRTYFKPAINRLLETTLNFYGKEHNVDIDFASPSLINKDRLLDRTMKKLDAGLIDIEEAIRETNPDLDEETIQARIVAAKKRQEEMMLAQFTEMNQEGGFGNNTEDVGGANLSGSTLPIQGLGA